MSYGTPYTNPGHFGLELIHTIEWHDEPYSFDYTCVWRGVNDGVLYLASDAGCSCPSPFEEVRNVDDLTVIHDLDEFRAELEQRTRAKYHREEIQSLYEKLRAL